MTIIVTSKPTGLFNRDKVTVKGFSDAATGDLQEAMDYVFGEICLERDLEIRSCSEERKFRHATLASISPRSQ